MLFKTVFLVHERIFTHQDDENGSLSIDSVHTTLESANRWAKALADNRYEEHDNCADRNDSEPDTMGKKTQWCKLFAETITTPAEDDEFAIKYSVEPYTLEGDELEEDSVLQAASGALVAEKDVVSKRVFEGMKFSWVGELDDMDARDEIRYLVFDNGGAWQGIEKCLEGSISDYIIAGKNVPPHHQQIIDDKELPCLNRHAFLKMAKDLGLPKDYPQEPIHPLKCLAGLNFTVLGNEEEPNGGLSKALALAYGTQPACSHTSQMDYVVRRGTDSPADLQLFEEECRIFLKIRNPTVITSKQLVSMILKKIKNAIPSENPRLSITTETLKKPNGRCLYGLKFSVPTGDVPIEGTDVQNYIKYDGGQVLGSIHMMDLADYVVTGTNGLSDEHAALAAQHKVKVIAIKELRELTARLRAWRSAKDELSIVMGYLERPEKKTRKRKTSSISQIARKSAKLTA